jgi:hypothetical protein
MLSSKLKQLGISPEQAFEPLLKRLLWTCAPDNSNLKR